jgi:hypothetical protein
MCPPLSATRSEARNDLSRCGSVVVGASPPGRLLSGSALAPPALAAPVAPSSGSSDSAKNGSIEIDDLALRRLIVDRRRPRSTCETGESRHVLSVSDHDTLARRRTNLGPLLRRAAARRRPTRGRWRGQRSFRSHDSPPCRWRAQRSRAAAVVLGIRKVVHMRAGSSCSAGDCASSSARAASRAAKRETPARPAALKQSCDRASQSTQRDASLSGGSGLANGDHGDTSDVVLTDAVAIVMHQLHKHAHNAKTAAYLCAIARADEPAQTRAPAERARRRSELVVARFEIANHSQDSFEPISE